MTHREIGVEQVEAAFLAQQVDLRSVAGAQCPGFARERPKLLGRLQQLRRVPDWSGHNNVSTPQRPALQAAEAGRHVCRCRTEYLLNGDAARECQVIACAQARPADFEFVPRGHGQRSV